MSVLVLATIGGLISFVATAAGSVLSLFTSRWSQSTRFSLSIDFALGLMVSASAFSLIGPAALNAPSSGLSMMSVAGAALIGGLFVWVLKYGIHRLQAMPPVKISHLLLATTLMVHNFPEGLASGAALGGLGWNASLPILGGIALQNIPEGALMVICLRAMGAPLAWAFWGGVSSGVVELGGGILAGLLLQMVNNALPLLLSAAGGAMIVSVLLELLEGEVRFSRRVISVQFAAGLACLPLIQALSA